MLKISLKGGESVAGNKMKGVHVLHRKNTASCEPERIPIPEMVTIPMGMHIGAPAKPIVKPGDEVKVGQRIAEAGGFVSAPIHSGVSGKVKKIEDILVANGSMMPAVFIETDGQQEVCPDLKAPDVHDFDSFVQAIKDSGVVGLGGAGFPTGVKFSVDASKVEAVLINGAECEPYITSDTRTMLDQTDLIWDGIKMIQKYLGVKRIIIGIEDNKPECISKFQALCNGTQGVEVSSMPALYPKGGEKVLIYNTVQKIVPEGKLPIDVGVIVVNCTTLAAIAKYIETGMPLVEKCITVDGSAVAQPKNVIAPIGTPVKYIFDYCGGFKSEPKKILYGGPMMGISMPSLECPVLKNTNALLAFDESDAKTPEPSNCIKCGRCIDTCPLRLMPADLETAFNLKKPEDLKELKVNLCMECGCCSYVCPAKRPLVQTNKLAKAMLNKYNAQLKAEAEAKAAKKAKE